MASSNEPFVVSCAGRLFEPGMLYDARTDKPLPGMSLWQSDNLEKWTRKIQKETCRGEYKSDTNFSSKASLLGIKGSLKLSALSGLINLEGSAAYLNDTKSSRTSEKVSFVYNVTTEAAIFPVLEHPIEIRNALEKDLATHVVSSVEYGAKAVFSFEREKEDQASEQKIEGSLEVLLAKAPISGKGGGEWGDEEMKAMEKVSCTFYGDFSLTSTPTNMMEAVKVMKTLPELMKRAHKPISADLVPLCHIEKFDNKFVKEITEYIVDSVCHYYQEISDVAASVEVLQTKSKQFLGMHKVLVEFAEGLSKHKQKFCGELKRLIPSSRSSLEGESKLQDLVSTCRNESPFSPMILRSWMEARKSELCVLQVWIKSLMEFGAEQVKPGKLPSVLAISDRVKALTVHLRSNSQDISWLKRSSKPAEEEFESSWINSTAHIDALQAVSRLKNFLHENENSIKSGALKIFLTESVSKKQDSNPQWEFISKLEFHSNGKVEMFDIPSAPSKVEAEEITETSVKVCWTPPIHGASSVKAYRLSYRKADMLEYKWKDVEAASLTVIKDLRPDTTYSFKVQSLTVAGISPAASSSTFRTKGSERCAFMALKHLSEEVGNAEDGEFRPEIKLLRKTLYENCKGDELLSSCSYTKSYFVGNRFQDCDPPKYFLLLGEKATGKTTLVNGLVNSYYKVRYSDPFRFKLVEDNETSLCTKQINIYTLYPVEGEDKGANFPLAIVDTPGFGEGTDGEKETVQMLIDLIRGRSSVQIGSLHGIGVVFKAGQDRIYLEQKYILDEILSVFGKDMSDLIFPVLTYGESSEPRILQALKDEIPSKVFFEVNNGMLYGDNRGPEAIESDETLSDVQKKKLKAKFYMSLAQWESNELSYGEMLKHLGETKNGVRLDSSSKVIENRLKMISTHLLLNDGLWKQVELEECIKLIGSLKGPLDDAALGRRTGVINAQWRSTGGEPSICSGQCSCREKMECPYKQNFERAYSSRLVSLTKETMNVRQFLKKYDISVNATDTKETVLSALSDEHKRNQIQIADNLATIRRILLYLGENALRHFPLLPREYVDHVLNQNKVSGQQILSILDVMK